MAFGPDELARRRQERQQRQQQRQQQARQQQVMVKRLAIAGAVLVGVAILLFALSFASSGGESAPAQTEPTYATYETEPQGKETVIRFTAVGDLNVTDKVVDAGGPGLDFTNLFSDVMPLLADGDLTVVNLEGNLVGPPYGTSTCSAPSQMLQALAVAGVDMVQLANSRTISNGITGLNSTINTVRSVGLVPLGAYATEDDAEENGGYTMWEVKGVRVAVVAFTKGMDNMALPTGSEKCVNLLYNDYSSKYVDVNTEGITDILERVSKEDPDVTVAMVHWGSEFNDTHSKSQLEIRDLLLQNGVDVIIGSHPHYVQEIEFNASKGTLVAYSLGDFAGDGERMGTEYGIVLNVEITKNNETGATKVTGFHYEPIFITEGKNGLLRILRLDAAIGGYESDFLDKVSPEVYESMKNARERIEARVAPKED